MNFSNMDHFNMLAALEFTLELHLNNSKIKGGKTLLCLLVKPFEDIKWELWKYKRYTRIKEAKITCLGTFVLTFSQKQSRGIVCYSQCSGLSKRRQRKLSFYVLRHAGKKITVKMPGSFKSKRWEQNDKIKKSGVICYYGITIFHSLSNKVLPKERIQA